MWIWDKCPDVYLQAPLIAPIPGSVALLLPSAHHADNAETSRVALLQQSKPVSTTKENYIFRILSLATTGENRQPTFKPKASICTTDVSTTSTLYRSYVQTSLFTRRRRRRRWVIPTATAAALRRWQRIINGWWYFDRQCIVSQLDRIWRLSIKGVHIRLAKIDPLHVRRLFLSACVPTYIDVRNQCF